MATDHKFAQLMALRKRLRKNAKKIKRRIRIQTQSLRLTEKEINDIGLSINHLQAVRKVKEMDLK
jgi:hypothetical protein